MDLDQLRKVAKIDAKDVEDIINSRKIIDQIIKSFEKFQKELTKEEQNEIITNLELATSVLDRKKEALLMEMDDQIAQIVLSRAESPPSHDPRLVMDIQLLEKAKKYIIRLLSSRKGIHQYWIDFVADCFDQKIAEWRKELKKKGGRKSRRKSRKNSRRKTRRKSRRKTQKRTRRKSRRKTRRRSKRKSRRMSKK